MIPRDWITEWRSVAPWTTAAQVEQDLVISRALLAIFRDTKRASQFAFRGGTALSKLYFPSVARYSEDIDLVQVKAEPIGNFIDAIRSTLDPWLGRPTRTRKQGSVSLIYRFEAEEPAGLKLRLKVEINTREHFTVFGYTSHPFLMKSRWATGEAKILSYSLDELLGTKLRALYQRRKGRDLFDLWIGLTQGKADPERIVRSFLAYIKAQGLRVSQKEFSKNLEEKISSPDFRRDIEPLILPTVKYDPKKAHELVHDRLIRRLP